MDKKYIVDYDIATNFDKMFINELAKYNEFKWVYGKLNNDIVGGGRPSIRLPIVSWQEIESYIQHCHQNNIKFNYLLNALCLSGKEFQKEFHTGVIDLLKKIVEIGVDGVTVATPYLCEIVKRQFPELFISISVYNKVDSLNQLKYWKDLGADEVTLDQRVNRNFKKLKPLLSYAKVLNLRIRLIANNTCLHECPFHANHAVTHCHGSKSGEKSSIFHLDYQVLNCNLIKIKDPSRIMSSGWIRPEDVIYYEQLCEEIDFTMLSLKLTERGRTTEWLKNVANAYAKRSYEGNLIDILNYVGKGNMYGKLHDETLNEEIKKQEYNLDKVTNYRKSIFYDLPEIDNKKLDHFLDYFRKNYCCDEKICGVKTDEHHCSYCNGWADRVVKFNENSRNQAIESAEKALEDVNSSKIFFREEVTV